MAASPKFYDFRQADVFSPTLDLRMRMRNSGLCNNNGLTEMTSRPSLPAMIAEQPSLSARAMQAAFDAAEAAAARGEVPVGAALVDPASGEIIAVAGNRVEELADPTAHAEVLAIRAACALRRSPRLPGLDLYVTLEPCAMCAATISFARLRRLVFAAYDPKGGGVEHGARFFSRNTCHHAPDVVGGVEERRAADLLRRFFQGLRAP
jgi:tRNA(adenine34) deaminase